MPEFFHEGPPDQLRRLRRGRPAPGADPWAADEPPHVRPAGTGDGGAGEPGADDRPARTRALGPPPEMINYSMTFFAQQVVGLLDHLELERGGDRRHLAGRQHHSGDGPPLPRAGAGNDARDAGARQRPARGRVIFTPILLGLRFGEPLLRGVASLTRPHSPNELPDRHRPRLAAPGPGALGGDNRGPLPGLGRAPSWPAGEDGSADDGDRPPRRPAPSLLRTPACSSRSCRTRS